MAKRKKSTKRSEDLNELLELSKPQRTKHTYTTINGQEYSIEIDDVFTIGKIEEAIEDYFTLIMCANKFNTDEEIQPDSNLLFAILIQKFTDKDFTSTETDIMKKFQKYVVVANTLHSIELSNGLTLYQQIIVDFGQDNLNKVQEATKGFNQSLTENKDQILEMIKPQDEEGDEDGDEEI